MLLDGINVLVADDDKLNQKIITYILQKKGACVMVAGNGEEAVPLLAGNRFDVVILDIQMPIMDGYATSRYIRSEMNSNVPIIALTADSFATAMPEYREAGMNECISKPVDPAVLCDLIVKLTNEAEVKSEL